MKRDPYGICSGFSNIPYVFAGYIIVFKLLPELVGKIGAYHLPESLINQMCGASFSEAKHITFRIQPVTEINSPYKKIFTIRSKKVGTVYRNKLRIFGAYCFVCFLTSI